jgi:hypothetical protein
LLFQALPAPIGVDDRIDGFLKDDLLSGMLEALLGEPSPMCQRPMTAVAASIPKRPSERVKAKVGMR